MLNAKYFLKSKTVIVGVLTFLAGLVALATGFVESTFGTTAPAWVAVVNGLITTLLRFTVKQPVTTDTSALKADAEVTIY